MATIDCLLQQGFSIQVCGNGLKVSPASKLTSELREYIRSHRSELLAEAAARDGETRRACWEVFIPGQGSCHVQGEPCTRAGVLAHARGIWPDAYITEANERHDSEN